MSKFLLTCILLCSFCIYSISAANDKFVIVIDAGHGGKDTGATRDGYKEKSINLGVALVLGQLIESNMKDVKVVYTRKSDVFVDLHKRSDIANKAKANLFISIHTNSTASKITTAEGADTYILGLARSAENLAVAKRENSVILLEDDYNKRYEGFDPNSPESYIIFEFMTDKYMAQSLDFASSVQKGFQNISRRKDRGVRQAGFLVLRESAMPSVLIELGFINNPQEAKYLSSTTGQRSMASSIYVGIEKYIKNFEKMQNTAVSVNSENQLSASAPKNKSVKSKDNIVKQTVSSPAVVATDISSDIIDPIVKDPIELGNSIPEKTATSDLSNTFYEDKQSLSDTKAANAPTTTTSLKEKNSNNDTPIINKKTKVEKQNGGLNVDESSVIVSKPNITKTATKEVDSSVPKPVSKSVIAKGAIEYRVQFLISQTKLPLNSLFFKGLKPVGEYIDGGTYKYTYGSTNNENEAIEMRNEIRLKFKDAFIVKFINGVRTK